MCVYVSAYEFCAFIVLCVEPMLRAYVGEDFRGSVALMFRDPNLLGGLGECFGSFAVS